MFFLLRKKKHQNNIFVFQRLCSHCHTWIGGRPRSSIICTNFWWLAGFGTGSLHCSCICDCLCGCLCVCRMIFAADTFQWLTAPSSVLTQLIFFCSTNPLSSLLQPRQFFSVFNENFSMLNVQKFSLPQRPPSPLSAVSQSFRPMSFMSRKPHR